MACLSEWLCCFCCYKNPRSECFLSTLIMSLFVLSQILIGFAICSDIITFQFKKREYIVACLLVSCILISLHFMCLGHWTAACLGMIAAVRFLINLFSTSKIFLWIFIGIVVVVTALTYEGPLSIIGCLASLFGTIASFSKGDKRLRQFMFICTSIWIVHNYLAGSPGAVFMEIFFLCSNLVGYFRYYIRPKKMIL